MRISISIEYYTVPGESLSYLWPDGKETPMSYVSDGLWRTEVNVPSNWKTVDYGFVLKRDGKTVRREWAAHSLNIPSSRTIKSVEVQDRWNDRPSDAPFWTKAFTDVIFGGRAVSGRRRSGNLALLVACPDVRRGEALAITGSGALFDDWKKFIPLSGGPIWKVYINPSEPFEYKFVIIDEATGSPKCWETGSNRKFFCGTGEGTLQVIREREPAFDRKSWRGSGVAIPVFSL